LRFSATGVGAVDDDPAIDFRITALAFETALLELA
jgi:hypothetical protein